MEFATGLSLAFTGGLLVLVGVAIRYGGAVELVAGYDADRVTDEAALGNLVGGYVVAVGVLTALMWPLSVVDPLAVGAGYWVAYLLVVLGSVAGVAMRCRRFTVDEPPS